MLLSLISIKENPPFYTRAKVCMYNPISPNGAKAHTHSHAQSFSAKWRQSSSIEFTKLTTLYEWKKTEYKAQCACPCARCTRFWQQFDGKNFPLWKEMMQDVLVQKCQIEAIRHTKVPTGKTLEEWRFVNELVRLMIRMHQTENVYFSMAKEKTTFELWEKLQALYEKKSNSSKIILIW